MLLLFDIDGTLLRGASEAHALAIYAAVREVYGVAARPGDPAMPRVQAAGRTDLEIAREIALLWGCSAQAFDDGREGFVDLCLSEYARLVPPDLSGCVVSAMPELLSDLAADPGVRLALVTGNLEGVARLKLNRAGIGAYFPQGQGGFGSDSEDRTDLPAIARARAGGPDGSYPRARTVVIGDTPLDIACARADGVGCIAVTSGPYGALELEGADAVAGSTAQLRRLLSDQLRTSFL